MKNMNKEIKKEDIVKREKEGGKKGGKMNWRQIDEEIEKIREVGKEIGIGIKIMRVIMERRGYQERMIGENKEVEGIE